MKKEKLVDANRENKEKALHSKIAENIRLLRKKSGKTQAEIADALGKTRAYVVNLETGRTIPQIYVLYELADFFGCTLYDIAPPSLKESDCLPGMDSSVLVTEIEKRDIFEALKVAKNEISKSTGNKKS